MSKTVAAHYVCKFVGHRWAVVWNMDGKSEATYCPRCGVWKKHEARVVGAQRPTHPKATHTKVTKRTKK